MSVAANMTTRLIWFAFHPNQFSSSESDFNPIIRQTRRIS
jgi:hypothetical protein